jgi:hypothetical protein
MALIRERSRPLGYGIVRDGELNWLHMMELPALDRKRENNEDPSSQFGPVAID